MSDRPTIAQTVPDLYGAIRALDDAVVGSGLDTRLLHLVKLRASQINGCAYCVDRHVKEALADGVPERQLHLLSVWWESPLFDDRDRAVLKATECLTRLPEAGLPDDAYEALRAHFPDEEIGRIIVAAGLINIWNRIAVGTRMRHPIDRATAA